MASTLRPDEVKVKIVKSLRAAAAAVGVRSPPTEQRTTFEPIEKEPIIIVREALPMSSTALETKIGDC